MCTRYNRPGKKQSYETSAYCFRRLNSFAYSVEYASIVSIITKTGRFQSKPEMSIRIRILPCQKLADEEKNKRHALLVETLFQFVSCHVYIVDLFQF